MSTDVSIKNVFVFESASNEQPNVEVMIKISFRTNTHSYNTYSYHNWSKPLKSMIRLF